MPKNSHFLFKAIRGKMWMWGLGNHLTRVSMEKRTWNDYDDDDDDDVILIMAL